MDHLFPYTGQTGTGDIDVESLHVYGSVHGAGELEFGIAWWRVGFMIFEAVQIFVSLPAYVAAEGLFFLHAHRARVGDRRFRVDDGKSAVCVFV